MGDIKISKKQIQIIYALGAKTGTLEQGNKDDALHIIVERVTGKNSVKELTEQEFNAVAYELRALLPAEERKESKGKTKEELKDEKEEVEEVAGMITSKQQALAWRFIYRLAELDPNSEVSNGKRLCGAIEKLCGVSSHASEPFRFVTFEMGEKLIENLKRYVRSAERRAKSSNDRKCHDR